MRHLPHFLPFLIIFTAYPVSAPFSDYSRMLPQEHPASSAFLLISPESCGVFDFPFSPLPLEAAPADSEDSLGSYSLAMRDLLNARKIYRYLPDASIFPPPLSLISYACFSLGISSVNHAIDSVESAFILIDSKFSALDFLQGDEEVYSSGISDEAKRISEEIASRKPGHPLSALILRSSQNLTALWSGFPHSNLGEFSVISILVGGESALSEAFLLGRKMDSAMEALRALELRASREYKLLQFEADAFLKDSEEEALQKIRESEALFLLGQDVLSTSGGKRTFYSEHSDLKKQLRKAELLHSDGERALQEKKRGHLGYSILRKQASNDLLSEIIARAEGMLSGAESLEGELLLKRAAMEREARDRLQEKQAEPLVHSYLSKKLSDYELLLSRGYLPAPRGERINLLLEELGVLKSLVSAAAASDTIAHELLILKGKMDRMEGLLKKAESEGIDVSSLKNRFAAAKSALANLQMESDAQLVLSLSDEIDDLVRALAESAREKFPLLQQMYEALGALEGFLPAKDRLYLAQLEEEFSSPEFDYLSSLGSLSAADSFLRRKLEELEMRKPELLKTHLQSTLSILESADPAPPGVQSQVTAYAHFRNFYDLSADEIMLPLPLPPNSLLLNASPGISLIEIDGKPHLRVANLQKGEYFAVLQYSAVLNSVISEAREVRKATSEKLVFSLTYRLKTEKRSQLLLEAEAPFPGTYGVIAPFPHFAEKTGGTLKLTLDLPPGENAFSIIYSIPGPFPLSASNGNIDGNSMEYFFEYQNPHADVPEALLELQEYTACEIAKVMTQLSDFDVQDNSRGNYLLLQLRARDWAAGSPRRLRLRLICNNAISGLLAKELGGAPGNASVFDRVSSELTRQSLSEGNFAAVLNYLKGQEADAASISADASLARLEGILPEVQESGQAALHAELKELLDSARNHLLSGQSEKALSNVKSANTLLASFFGEKLQAGKARCKAKCPGEMLAALDALSTSIALRDYKAAFAALRNFEGAAGEDEAGSRNLLAGIGDALEGLSSLSEQAEPAIANFADYFKESEESAYSMKRYAIYKRAAESREALEKGLAELQKIRNSYETGGAGGKYSPEYADSKMKAAGDSLQSLAAANEEMRLLSEKEVSEAGKRHLQFGSRETAARLEEINSAYESENHYLAYFLARQLNSELIPPPAEKKTDLLPYALPSIALLLGLSYFMLFKGKEKQVI